MTLDKILSKARALEASETQATGMEESQSSEVTSQIVSTEFGETRILVNQRNSTPDHSQVCVVNVVWRGPTQGIHAQLKVKAATNVVNQIILPKCA